MRRRLLGVTGGLVATAVVVGVLVTVLTRSPRLPELNPVIPPPSEAEAPVPWREPEADLKTYFPGADGHREDQVTLSNEWRSLRTRLGRSLTSEDYLLRLHRVLRGKQGLGSVLVRRVRGSAGAIEIVLPLDEEGRLLGLRVQRHRETGEAARALEHGPWRQQLAGLTVEQAEAAPDGSDPPPVRDLRRSIREALILVDVARRSGVSGQAHH